MFSRTYFITLVISLSILYGPNLSFRGGETRRGASRRVIGAPPGAIIVVSCCGNLPTLWVAINRWPARGSGRKEAERERSRVPRPRPSIIPSSRQLVSLPLICGTTRYLTGGIRKYEFSGIISLSTVGNTFPISHWRGCPRCENYVLGNQVFLRKIRGPMLFVINRKCERKWKNAYKRDVSH